MSKENKNFTEIRTDAVRKDSKYGYSTFVFNKQLEEILIQNMSGKMIVFSSSMPKEEREKLFKKMLDL